MPGQRFEDVFRAEWGRVLAALVGSCGDVDVAEEAAQEAFATAAQRWEGDGPPEHPRAWLVAVGRNRAVDRVRRERRLASRSRCGRSAPNAATCTAAAAS